MLKALGLPRRQSRKQEKEIFYPKRRLLRKRKLNQKLLLQIQDSQGALHPPPVLPNHQPCHLEKERRIRQ